MAHRDNLQRLIAMSPLEMAAIKFVEACQGTDRDLDGKVEKFEGYLFPSELEAWDELEAAVAGVRGNES